jgi:glycosyltransferase involved in cell wall biosynthesis
MAKPKVAFIVHGHPSIAPGGAEQYTLELYEGMKASGTFDPLLVARTGAPFMRTPDPHIDSPFTVVPSDPNQYLLHTDLGPYNWFLGVPLDKRIHTRHFREFLLAHRPDIVHFQHTSRLGYDLIREVRHTLPKAAILYTLHEFLPICFNNGQLVRTTDGSRCLEPTPRQCTECFPDISPQNFFLRKRFIQAQFALVDRFLAPSRFLLERFVEWGIPRTKILYEEYGRAPARRRCAPTTQGTHDSFGFFGQLTPYKGAGVAIDAMRQVDADVCRHTPSRAVPHLRIHGANLDIQPEQFRRTFARSLEAAGERVTFVGAYRHDKLPELMQDVDWVIVPSIWWENSPLVIQEAFQYGRPVICSDIGGMAEKVEHGVNGLHFRAGDPRALAEVIESAATTEGLWERLQSGIPRVYTVQETVARHASLYDELMEARQAA